MQKSSMRSDHCTTEGSMTLWTFEIKKITFIQKYVYLLLIFFSYFVSHTVNESVVGSSSLSHKNFHFCGKWPSSVSNLWMSFKRCVKASGTHLSILSYLKNGKTYINTHINLCLLIIISKTLKSNCKATSSTTLVKLRHSKKY